MNKNPAEFRMPGDLVDERGKPVTPDVDGADDWFFERGKTSTCFKLLAMHKFLRSWKASMSLHKGNESKFTMKYRRELHTNKPPLSGTIGVQKAY
jgi:hypothetical protein